jgi:hypothetical protein
MASRRDFFKQFIGQVGVFRDEIKGVEKIPLNRLNELPQHIIEDIKPVLFPETDWSLNGNALSVRTGKDKLEEKTHFDKLELQIFEYFRQGRKLKQIANALAIKNSMEYDLVYQKVTSLFFRLAIWRVCHPAKAYNIDELTNKEGGSM